MLDDNNYEKYGDYGGNYQKGWGADEFRHNGFHILGHGALRHIGFFFLLMVLSNRDVTEVKHSLLLTLHKSVPDVPEKSRKSVRL